MEDLDCKESFKSENGGKQGRERRIKANSSFEIYFRKIRVHHHDPTGMEEEVRDGGGEGSDEVELQLK